MNKAELPQPLIVGVDIAKVLAGTPVAMGTRRLAPTNFLKPEVRLENIKFMWAFLENSFLRKNKIIDLPYVFLS